MKEYNNHSRWLFHPSSEAIDDFQFRFTFQNRTFWWKAILEQTASQQGHILTQKATDAIQGGREVTASTWELRLHQVHVQMETPFKSVF